MIFVIISYSCLWSYLFLLINRNFAYFELFLTNDSLVSEANSFLDTSSEPFKFDFVEIDGKIILSESNFFWTFFFILFTFLISNPKRDVLILLSFISATPSDFFWKTFRFFGIKGQSNSSKSVSPFLIPLLTIVLHRLDI